jgi:hypothetical protein
LDRAIKGDAGLSQDRSLHPLGGKDSDPWVFGIVALASIVAAIAQRTRRRHR